MTYNERVRALAEKMAILKYPTVFNQFFDNSVDAAFNGQEQEHSIEVCKPFAKITIDYTMGILSFVLCELGWDVDCSDKYLKTLGLIPDSGQEFIPMKPGEHGYAGYDPNNAEPDQADKNWKL